MKLSLNKWAFGLLLYTIMVRITVPVLNGELTVDTLHPSESGGRTQPTA